MITCQMLSSSAGVSFPIEVMYRFWRAMSVCSAWEKFQQYFRHQSSLHIVKFYWVDYSFKMWFYKYYLCILCVGIHKGQRCLREVCVGTVCDQTRGPTNQGFMREVFNLLEEKGMRFITLAMMVKNKIGKYFLDFCKWVLSWFFSMNQKCTVWQALRQMTLLSRLKTNVFLVNQQHIKLSKNWINIH